MDNASDSFQQDGAPSHAASTTRLVGDSKGHDHQAIKVAESARAKGHTNLLAVRRQMEDVRAQIDSAVTFSYKVLLYCAM